MPLNQNIVNAQTEINRAVWAINLSPDKLRQMKEFGDAVVYNKKSAMEYARYHAQQAINELNKFLEG